MLKRIVNSLKRSTPCIQGTDSEKVSSGGLCLLDSLMKWSWRLLLTGLTVLVILVAGGRLMFSALPVLQPELSRFLSERLNADLQIESMSAKWNGGEPWLSLRGLTLRGKEADLTGFSIKQLDMELSLRQSLLHWTPVFSSLEINGVNVDLVQGDGAQWSLSGIQQVAGSSLQAPEYRKGSALEWLALQQMVDIRNIRLNMRKANGESSDINGRHLTVLTDGDRKDLSARLEVGAGYLEIDGAGIASRGLFSKWDGTAVAINLNAEQLCALWAGCYDDVLAAMMQMDARWRYDHGFWQVQGEVASPDVTYLDNSGALNHLSGQTHLFMQGERESSWQIWLNGLKLENRLQNGIVYQWENSWYLTGGRKEEYTVTVATQSLDLDLLKRWLLDTDALPKSVAKLVDTLNPIGQLSDLAIRFYPSRKPFDFDLSARLDNVSVDAWQGAPSGGNVSGQLRMNLLQGYLDLNTRDFQLGFPKLFRETWTFDTAKARLYWDVIDDFYILKSDDLALMGPEGDLKGKLRLDIPLKWHEGDTLDMALTVGMSNGDARYTGKYLPAFMPMDSNLVHWLDTAIRKADISAGGFIYSGALVGDEDGIGPQDSRWGLFFDIHDGELDYAPDWPVITGLTGQVYVNDDRVEVLGQSAKSAGGKLADIIARVPLEGESILRISSHLNANGETLKHFLTRTPIDDWMEGEAKKWQLQGRFDAGMNLTLPLDDLEQSEVDIRSAVKSFNFAIPELGIDVNDIGGDLSFSTKQGLNARELSGQLFGNPARFQIRSAVVNQQPVTTDIDWSGKISVTSLHDWLKLDWLSLLEGETDYRASLSLGILDNSTELRVDSELLGVEVELPAPVGKTVDTPLPLDLSLIKKEGHEILNVTLANLGRLEMKMTPEFSPESALITLGADSVNSGSFSDKGAVGNKFLVTGSLPQLDFAPWKARFEGQPGKPGEQQLASRIELENVRIGSLKYGDYNWPNVAVSLQQAIQRQGAKSERKGMQLSVDGKTLKGDLWIPEHRAVPWALNIDYVHLPESALLDSSSEASSKNSVSEAEDSLAEVNPATLPNLDVKVSHLQVGSRTPASIGFKLRHAPHGVKIDNITGELAGMSLSGLADWVQMDGEQRSWVQGGLKGTGIRELQKALGFSGFLEARESRFDASLNWDGSPLGGTIASMKGRVDVLLKKGRLRKVDNGSSGALKLFGIFNTEALTRRMKLDFSDLYSSGISFDQIRGSLNFNRGVITFDSPMVIEGPSSDFKLDGTIDTNSEQLDLSLVVTLPVSSNLPILSVLLGTAPQVAGIIYIADKLVGKQVDQLASIRYRIHGSFDDPKMTLDKLFSNQPRKSRSKKEVAG